MQFCTTEHPQLFEFEVASCRTFRLRSKKAILEVAIVLGSFEYLERLKAKLESVYFFMLKYSKITVCRKKGFLLSDSFLGC